MEFVSGLARALRLDGRLCSVAILGPNGPSRSESKLSKPEAICYITREGLQWTVILWDGLVAYVEHLTT
jgi:hypothetical protein